MYYTLIYKCFKKKKKSYTPIHDPSSRSYLSQLENSKNVL